MSVVVPYCVPEGVCVAITVAPGKGSPLLSVTIPFTEEVVTWPNNDKVEIKNIARVSDRILPISFRLGERVFKSMRSETLIL